MSVSSFRVREPDLVEVLFQQHQELRRSFADLEDTSDPCLTGFRRGLTDQLLIDLTRHAVIEERYLYPAMREYLSDGEGMERDHAAEHHVAEVLMRDLETLDAQDRRFDLTLAVLTREVRTQIRNEEATALARLRVSGDARRLVALGRSATRTPRLSVGDELPAGPGLVDRARKELASV